MVLTSGGVWDQESHLRIFREPKKRCTAAYKIVLSPVTADQIRNRCCSAKAPRSSKGIDAPPFPGGQPHVLLGQPNGTYSKVAFLRSPSPCATLTWSSTNSTSLHRPCRLERISNRRHAAQSQC